MGGGGGMSFDSRFRVGNPFTLAEPIASGHNRGIGSANVKRTFVSWHERQETTMSIACSSKVEQTAAKPAAVPKRRQRPNAQKKKKKSESAIIHA